MEKCSDNNECVTDAILAFDTLYTTNHMKILKLLLPYLEGEYQKKLAVFIKWQELIFTLNFFRQYSASLYSFDFTQKKKMDLNLLLPLLTPYCSESEKSILSQFSGLQNMLNMMEEIQQYMPMIQQLMASMSDGNLDISGLFGNGENNTASDTSDSVNPMMDMLKNMMSEEQQAMFSMYMNEGR